MPRTHELDETVDAIRSWMCDIESTLIHLAIDCQHALPLTQNNDDIDTLNEIINAANGYQEKFLQLRMRLDQLEGLE